MQNTQKLVAKSKKSHRKKRYFRSLKSLGPWGLELKKIQKQGSTGTLKTWPRPFLVTTGQWTAENILNSAHQLKKCSTKLYQTVYLAKDRTEEEMKYHRKLVSELKSKIKAHPTTRWVIQNEEIVNKGQYC